MIGKYYLKRVGGYDPLANAHSLEQVYLLWIAMYPQTDTLTLVGVFSTRQLAMEADEHFRKYRTIIEERLLNQLQEDIP